MPHEANISRRLAPRHAAAWKVVSYVLLPITAVLMPSGCGFSGKAVSSAAPLVLGGTVNGGSQPVSGASIQLYAAGTAGAASAAQPLLSSPAHTDSSGRFSITTAYECPSPTAPVYVVAQGGNPGLAAGVNNPALTMTAMVGSCSGLSATPIAVNEVTTVGTVWPLAHYMATPSNVGAAAGDTAFSSAVASVPEFVNLALGTSPGTPAANSYFAESAKLYSLADVLAACVNSAGGSAGDGSPCGALFSMATPAGGAPPTDTMTAAIHIAQNPDNDVAGIYGLAGGDMSFAPTLTAAPTDWTLTLSYPVATPLISVATGTYAGPQQVTITDPTAGSVIHYTTDGTTPTSASPTYTGAFSVSTTTTIQAIAVFSGSLSTVATSTLTFAIPPAPARLVFSQQPTNTLAAATITPAVQVSIVDASGNLVADATNPVTLELSGGAALVGTLTMAPVNGVATFSNLSVNLAGSGYTLLATSSGLISASSTPFTISAPATPPATPAKLAFVQEPTNGLLQTPLSPAVQVAVEDASGNVISTATNAVTVALTSGTGLGGTLTVSPVNGIATFNNLTVSVAGSGYVLSAGSPGLSSATSTTFSITAAVIPPPSAARLAFLQQPANAVVQTVMSPPVQVAVVDVNGNLVTTAGNTVTLTLNGGTGLGGTVSVAALDGIATFSNLTVSVAGNGYTLAAASSGLAGATSNAFNITAPVTPPPAAARLAFVQQPTNTVAQSVMTPAVQVAIEDASGNIVTTATNSVTLSLVNGTGLGGTLTVAAVNGIATFSNLTVSTAGASLSLSASSSGLTAAASNLFNITAPAAIPVKLAFVQQPTNALTQAIITPAVQVAVEDVNGNVVASAANPVTLTLVNGSGLGGTLTVSAANGVATFSTLTVSTAGTGLSLSASSAGLTSAASGTFTISAPPVVSNGTTILQSLPVNLTATPGGTFLITYNWQALPVSGQYSVFVHFVDSSGTVQFQDNVQPPTAPSQWNGPVTYTHTVTVPAGTAVGKYTIVAGLSSAAGNLSIVAGPNVSALGNGDYQIGALTLEPACSITAFGAVGDGVTDNLTAIQNTFNYAAANGCIALIPAGTFAYSGMLTATGIAVEGSGAGSILAPLSLTNEALSLAGTGGSISNLAMVSTATQRLTTPWSGMIWVNGAQNYYVDNVLINDSSSIGIMSYNSSNGYIFNNTVANTLADGITQIVGSNNITVSGNRIVNCGDDGISNNSYVGDAMVHDITVQGNTVLNNIGGRGIEVSGGNNITFTGNYVDNPDGYTDVYIASESEWNTQGVSNVTVTGNTLVAGGPNQGSALIYNSQTGLYNITGVTITGNQFVNPLLVALQLTGSGSETNITVESNTDYSNSIFGVLGSGLGTISGNQVLSPSIFTTSLAPAGGGCTFSGC